MKYLTLALQYLPGVLATVKAVETELSGQPGRTKKLVVMGAIQGAAQSAGQNIPNEHIQVVSALTDHVVGTLNASGVFQTRATSATLNPLPGQAVGKLGFGQ